MVRKNTINGTGEYHEWYATDLLVGSVKICSGQCQNTTIIFLQRIGRIRGISCIIWLEGIVNSFNSSNSLGRKKKGLCRSSLTQSLWFRVYLILEVRVDLAPLADGRHDVQGH